MVGTMGLMLGFEMKLVQLEDIIVVWDGRCLFNWKCENGLLPRKVDLCKICR